MSKTAFQKCVRDKTKGKGGTQGQVQNRLARAAKECSKKK